MSGLIHDQQSELERQGTEQGTELKEHGTKILQHQQQIDAL